MSVISSDDDHASKYFILTVMQILPTLCLLIGFALAKHVDSRLTPLIGPFMFGSYALSTSILYYSEIGENISLQLVFWLNNLAIIYYAIYIHMLSVGFVPYIVWRALLYTFFAIGQTTKQYQIDNSNLGSAIGVALAGFGICEVMVFITVRTQVNLF